MSTRKSRSRLAGYALAVAAVALVAVQRAAYGTLLGDTAPFLPLVLAVTLAASVGGLGPGLFATLAGTVLAVSLWYRPELEAFELAPGPVSRVLMFAFVGSCLSVVGAALRSARVTAEGRADDLRDREEAYRRLLETASEGIWTLDERGRIGFVNEAMARTIGIDADELCGQRAIDFVVEEDRAATFAAFRRAFKGERVAIDVRLGRLDGMQLWARVSAAPIPDARGMTIGVLGTVTDVTAKHVAESELQRSLESEKRAREEAESANRAKDVFLATVSHELRTPLNAILGWLSMMKTGTLGEAKTARALEVIDRNARSQAKLIEDLLDVSRMIAGKLRIERKRAALGPIAQSALDVVRPIAAEKGIELLRSVPPNDELVVAGDPERLKQILVNLLSNAVKFTPRGGHVTLAIARYEGTYAIEVRDDGQGISPEFLPHVFARFQQEDPGMTRKHSGLGLGLAIVRTLVEMHGGSVDVRSDGLGKGATFTVTLPALDADTAARLPEPVETTSDEMEKAKAPGALAGLRLLLVDDERDSLDMLTERLVGAGAEVRAVTSAATALSEIASFQPDVLITDLAMPEQDGYDLVASVRALSPQRGGRIPALALTAHARVADRIRVLASGFQAYLAKPVELDELLVTVRRIAREPVAAPGVRAEA